MCSAKAFQKTMRVANAVATGGVSEGVRAIAHNNPNNVLSKATELTETGPTKIYNYAANALGAPPLPGSVPDAPPPGDLPPPPPPGAPPPPSTILASDPTELAAQLRRKRLLALRGGVGSTIFAGAGSQNTPNLMSPTAMAAGMKSKLGQ